MGSGGFTFSSVRPIAKLFTSWSTPTHVAGAPSSLASIRAEHRKPRPGAPPASGRLSGGVLVLAKDKPLSGTRLTARTLVGCGTGGEDGRPCTTGQGAAPMSTIAAA